jgi:hypothetical protein
LGLCYLPSSDVSNAFNHFVEVLWSPDSSAFIVNDWSPGPGSYIDSYLYHVNDPAHPLDIGDKLQGLIKDKENKMVFSGDLPIGLSIYALEWLNSKSVEMHINGAFKLTYIWDLKNSLKRISNKEILVKAISRFDEEFARHLMSAYALVRLNNHVPGFIQVTLDKKGFVDKALFVEHIELGNRAQNKQFEKQILEHISECREPMSRKSGLLLGLSMDEVLADLKSQDKHGKGDND